MNDDGQIDPSGQISGNGCPLTGVEPPSVQPELDPFAGVLNCGLTFFQNLSRICCLPVVGEHIFQTFAETCILQPVDLMKREFSGENVYQ